MEIVLQSMETFFTLIHHFIHNAFAAKKIENKNSGKSHFYLPISSLEISWSLLYFLNGLASNDIGLCYWYAQIPFVFLFVFVVMACGLIGMAGLLCVFTALLIEGFVARISIFFICTRCSNVVSVEIIFE